MEKDIVRLAYQNFCKILILAKLSNPIRQPLAKNSDRLIGRTELKREIFALIQTPMQNFKKIKGKLIIICEQKITDVLSET